MARSRPGVNRLVTVWLPHWPALAIGRAGDEPVAVVHANRVVAASPAARDAGVLIGLRRREAQARSPGIHLVDHDPERDARRFEPIARAVGTLVPRIEITEPGWLTFAARGPTRYVGGEEALVGRILGLVGEGLADLGSALSAGSPLPVAVTSGTAITPADRGNPGAGDTPTAGATIPAGGTAAIGVIPAGAGADAVAGRPPVGIGIADGRFASGVAARQAAASHRPVIVPAGKAARYLSGFPLRALHDVAGVPCDLLDLFSRLGLHRLGQVAALPPRDVLARFGPPGSFAHRLAGGADPRPPDAVEPPAELTVTRRFDDALADLQPLVFVAKQMATDLQDEVQRRGLTVVRLAVEAETEHDERCERVWYRPEGLSPAAMVDRVRWQLDGWVRRPGGLTGGVVLLRLIPVETRADAGRQLGFWGGRTEADEWAGRTAARLIGLLGPDAVLVPERRGGRGPSESIALVSAAMVDLAARSARHDLPVALSADPGRRQTRRSGRRLPDAGSPAVAGGGSGERPWPGSLPAPSPSTVYTDPRPCQVLDAAGEPVGVTGRGVISATPVVLAVGQARREIVAWAGPWPVEERWWEPGGGRRRVRFQLVTDDGCASLVSLEQGTWFVEAVYT